MERRENSGEGREVELLSAEVQEVMGRMPPAIVRWGMTVMALIVAGMLAAAAYVRWPETAEYSFEGEFDGGAFIVAVSLPPETLQYISSDDGCYVTLYSPVFPDTHEERGISGKISSIAVDDHAVDYYAVTLKINVNHHDIQLDRNRKYSGNMLLLKSDKTLLQLILKNISLWY